MIKLVAIDLDGTLLNSKKEISERNKQALAKAKAAGVKIVICTGRPLAAIGIYLDALNLRDNGDYSITFNGGLVQKNDTGEIIEKASMPLENVHDLFELAAALNVPLDILSDGLVLQLPTTQNYESLYSQLNTLLTYESYELDQLTADRIYNKAVIAVEQTYLDEQIKKIPSPFYDRYEIIKTRSNLLEFMPKGITKAYGISLLARDLDINQEEIMTVGDEENDLPMIEYAGLGVAMENAVARVKDLADVITDTNDNDGVAQAVEKFVLEPLKGGI
ncbi:cof-like hydrolase [Enterococcus haemoperoxidus ATCC BAA-382]|uniref:Cof-like hydrolase n=1 Tax=Enterococcus haemoperoxidus ATCC BAA-382 TaxID=1158608 RepID=R2QPJ7_9ENTE|nr:Cof-type HAD-IIB family hydrolase [Enterococcus haemoperoxidus]EOH97178.1 cof-like hydrolase [Enterococcus haemoperoxidus ATCC BAA-382]EOT59991.1 HAD superfamily hydrolase [Enterococcus haemoperoxidus ATCC BAA-382]OJG56173.1 cof-like hydrolase [Enterococcus haemoperoxidus]